MTRTAPTSPNRRQLLIGTAALLTASAIAKPGVAAADGDYGPIFDAHFHIFDPEYPLSANDGFTPQPFSVSDYQNKIEGLNFAGGALVAASFQGDRQQYMLDGLAELGSNYVGVIQLAPDATDQDILKLDKAGVKGARVNIFREGKPDTGTLAALGSRIWDTAGWSLEVYASAKTLVDMEKELENVPQLVIDHLGMGPEALPVLQRLAEQGARIKASGFGRLGSMDIPKTLKAIASVNPESLMFGSDLPSTRAKQPFKPADIKLIWDALGDNMGRMALYDNAVAFYRPEGILSQP
ncbi:amidohydrolase [Roseibium sp. RKSG952]|uniref:amidohydrolase family protein n=1 Tax=Roseibium sp. RKSG952 TaxID=2529384 RepID=UPI0012BC01A0|nr:amidohydrolase family protein [Roseibium sp. RKSG952]MTH98974.1 2-pyrone-4,6-dicarboxylate hydrolase [Roseibium sp. RKSG952]